MAINHRPKVGELLECDFGRWSDPETVNGHIPPEMIKRRLVVVLNGDIDGHSVLVAPISSTKAYGRLATFHEYLSPDLIAETSFYEKRDRWVKAEHIRCVSKKRLHYVFDNGKKLSQYLPNDVVTAIQKRVLIAVSGKRILDSLNNEQ
ncbi:hypothetical protein BKG96_00290 [Rodentibacter caecimuris]|uniref:Growth inhibitor PemK n=1 Tax=Rodentibacter caecimuris TaxID=1796644 RepID=A0A1V3KRH4_9PAST|nr:type II toxin-antitoxin system PemK/MazF family toxin [Rodentibacter heylii]OOF79940.1 hypothetical protein BKG96_00290 [Rodentibacter heylii]